jgi:hypothetical protein
VVRLPENVVESAVVSINSGQSPGQVTFFTRQSC